MEERQCQINKTILCELPDGKMISICQGVLMLVWNVCNCKKMKLKVWGVRILDNKIKEKWIWQNK